jgi:hypothetical protein
MCAAWVCSDSDDGRGAQPHPQQEEAELEEDEFERMFKGAKGRKRRGANAEVALCCSTHGLHACEPFMS